MDKIKLEKAKRRAMNLFDAWNDVTGLFDEDSGYYAEIQGVIEDAVECGVQAALGWYEPLESEKDERTNDQAHVYPKVRSIHVGYHDVEEFYPPNEDDECKEPDCTALLKRIADTLERIEQWLRES
jgi:hypothetical protein